MVTVDFDQTVQYRIAGYFRGGNFHKLVLSNVFTGKFSQSLRALRAY